MIEIIKMRAVQGIAVTVNNCEFASVMAEYPQAAHIYKTAYNFASHTILAGVSSWLAAQSGLHSMVYFFEAGHASQTQANQIMHKLFSANEEQYSYAGHAFVPKEKNPAIQAADLLAWQWYKDKKNQNEGRSRRKDCANLLEKHHKAVHFNRDALLTTIISASLTCKA
jgi:hypothetical protein